MKNLDKQLKIGLVPTRREAFANETTTRRKEAVVKRFRELAEELDFEIVTIEDINEEGLLMTYHDVKAAYKKLTAAGVDALIVPDMPFEEREELLPACKAHGMTLIYLAAPTSSQRVKAIARETEGFVYCVSSLGVTGVRSEITTDVGAMVKMVKEANNVPCAVGFGISTPDQARRMAAAADGVIVGSAIVKLVAKYGADCVEPVSRYVREMKAAVLEAE